MNSKMFILRLARQLKQKAVAVDSRAARRVEQHRRVGHFCETSRWNEEAEIKSVDEAQTCFFARETDASWKMAIRLEAIAIRVPLRCPASFRLQYISLFVSFIRLIHQPLLFCRVGCPGGPCLGTSQQVSFHDPWRPWRWRNVFRSHRKVPALNSLKSSRVMV